MKKQIIKPGFGQFACDQSNKENEPSDFSFPLPSRSVGATPQKLIPSRKRRPSQEAVKVPIPQPRASNILRSSAAVVLNSRQSSGRNSSADPPTTKAPSGRASYRLQTGAVLPTAPITSTPARDPSMSTTQHHTPEIMRVAQQAPSQIYSQAGLHSISPSPVTAILVQKQRCVVDDMIRSTPINMERLMEAVTRQLVEQLEEQPRSPEFVESNAVSPAMPGSSGATLRPLHLHEMIDQVHLPVSPPQSASIQLRPLSSQPAATNFPPASYIMPARYHGVYNTLPYHMNMTVEEAAPHTTILNLPQPASCQPLDLSKCTPSTALAPSNWHSPLLTIPMAAWDQRTGTDNQSPRYPTSPMPLLVPDYGHAAAKVFPSTGSVTAVEPVEVWQQLLNGPSPASSAATALTEWLDLNLGL